MTDRWDEEAVRLCALPDTVFNTVKIDAIATALRAVHEACPLQIKVDDEGVWVTFQTSTGVSASLEIGALAQKQGHGIIQMALETWCKEQRSLSPTPASTEEKGK